MSDNKDKITIRGKVAEFPTNTRADDALKFLRSVNVNPKKIWYILIESQDNTLKMIKYNVKDGFDLYEYTQNLKEYYISRFKDDAELSQLIECIEIDGENEYSIIKNIPNIKTGNMSLISKIARDLVILMND